MARFVLILDSRLFCGNDVVRFTGMTMLRVCSTFV
jgi:hypothetical protein